MRNALLEFPMPKIAVTSEVRPVAARKVGGAEVELGLVRRGRRLARARKRPSAPPAHRGRARSGRSCGARAGARRAARWRAAVREGAEVVADPLEAERLPRCASSADAATSASRGAARIPVPSRSSDARPEHAGPAGREPDERLRDGGDEIADERDRLPPRSLSENHPENPCDDVLYRLSDSLDEAHDARARPQRLRQEDRQDGVEHLRRGVGE